MRVRLIARPARLAPWGNRLARTGKPPESLTLSLPVERSWQDIVTANTVCESNHGTCMLPRWMCREPTARCHFSNEFDEVLCGLHIVHSYLVTLLESEMLRSNVSIDSCDGAIRGKQNAIGQPV